MVLFLPRGKSNERELGGHVVQQGLPPYTVKYKHVNGLHRLRWILWKEVRIAIRSACHWFVILTNPLLVSFFPL